MNAIHEDHVILYGVTIPSFADIAATARMMSVWTGVWSQDMSEAALNWALKVHDARDGSKAKARCELRGSSALLFAVRTATSKALESSFETLSSCGYDSASAFDLLGKALGYLKNELVVQRLFNGAQLFSGVEDRDDAPDVVGILSASVACALLHACAKQFDRRIANPTGVLATAQVARAAWRNMCAHAYGPIEQMSDREFAIELDTMFINCIKDL